MKHCSTISSLGWNLMMYLGQLGSTYTYTHPYARHFIRKASYGGMVRVNVRDFELSANTAF